MYKDLKPDMYASDVFKIDYQKLLDKGINCLLIDLDNTLATADETVPNKNVIKLVEALKKEFHVILFSNSFKKRVEKFAKELDVEFYGFIFKPRQKPYFNVAKKHKYLKSHVACIGDQFRTDIKGAKKAGFISVLVDPINPKKDLALTFINRGIENWYIKKLRKKDLFKKGKYYN